MMRHPQHRQQQEQRGGLRIEQLQVDSPSGETLVHPLSLHLNPGEILGLIGESGSGKTTLATALLGHVRRGARIVSGRLTLDGTSHELASCGTHRAGAVAGLAYVPQSPGAHLNPSARLHEIFRDLLAGRWDAAAEERLQRSLGGAGLPGDAAFLRRYPHQLSGGQQQRVALAAALFKQARVLILDEPTSGLDLLTASHVVQTLLRLNREFGVALLCVSHDMRFIEQIAHRVAVMREGRIVEQGVVAEVLAASAHAYTRQLLAAIPGGTIRPPAAPAAATPAPPLLEVRALAARHGGAGLAVDDVSFAVGRGRWVALIGASGSGKTSIAAVLAGLQARCGGQVLLDGAPLPALAEQRDASQRRRIQIVLQDPQGSLNPRQTVRTAIARPLRFLRGLSGAELEREVLRLVQAVSLPAGILDNHAADLSGGECQRVAIARALAAQPDLLICDEITSALDVSVQAAILALLQELRVRLGLSILFITHQLDVVADVADELIVLETGRVIEAGPAASVLAAPRTEWMRRTVDALRQPPVPLPARRASA